MFFFNDTATTEIYTLSLHDALPISIHLDQLELPALRQFQLSLQPETVEQRLRDVEGDVVESTLRREQQLEHVAFVAALAGQRKDRKSTRLNSSHSQISYAVFCLKNK